ncbi:MAG: FtsX-like permease family protein [Dermatophilus congolensis]|nr:FtsX-like permease family protein [Dermatophilus congolensis]
MARDTLPQEQVSPAPRSERAPSPLRSPQARSSHARWAGWRIASRMARRDIRAHRGRSLLVMLMIALPMAIMVAAVGLYETADVRTAENPDAVIGSSAALLLNGGPHRLTQSPDGALRVSCGGERGQSGGLPSFAWGENPDKEIDGPNCVPARAIPGLVVPARGPVEPAAVVAPLSELVGAPVVPFTTNSVPLGIDFDYRQARILQADAQRDVFRGMVELTSGRWPSAPGEVVVTDAGRALGLPTSGTISSPTLSSVFGTDTVTVVGTGTSAKTPEGAYHLISYLPAADTLPGGGFLVDSSTPVTWEQVQRLNEFGLVVISRAVLDSPPWQPLGTIPGSGVDPGPSGAFDPILPTVLMLAVSCLIAGPAFTVMASRQRRMLALAAANGAPASQLRRTMITEAVLLGAAAVVTGVVVGVAVVAGVAATGYAIDSSGYGPLDIPVRLVLVIAVCGLLACVIAAVIPARRLGDLEIAGVLGGDEVSPPVRRRQPLIGVVLVLIGAVASVLAAALPYGAINNSDSVFVAVVGVAGLVSGALLLVPTVLTRVGRSASRMPVPARIAARDASRLRGRATSTVAAVMAGAIALSAFGIVAASADERARRDYVPSAPIGAMQLRPESDDPATDLVGAVEAAVPGVLASRMTYFFGEGLNEDGTEATGTGVVTPGCDITTRTWVGYQVPCTSALPNGEGLKVLAAEPEAARDTFGLTAQATEALRSGGAVALATPSPVIDQTGHVSLFRGTYAFDQEAGDSAWTSAPSVLTVPAVTGDVPLIQVQGQRIGVIVSPATAARLGTHDAAWPVYFVSATADTTGVDRLGLTDEQAAAVNRAVGGPFGAPVERGYQSQNWAVLGIIGGLFALLTLVATVTATALAIGEARRDLASLGAVGASPGIRRRIAAWQSGGLALIGITIGLLVGAVPGVVFGLAVTATPPGPFMRAGDRTFSEVLAEVGANLRALAEGFVVVPWPLLLAALVAVPLVAAAFGALFAGRPVDMTRRAD